MIGGHQEDGRRAGTENVPYIVGLAKNARLKRLARRSMITARWQHRCTGQKQRLFEELTYAAETWDQPRRVIAKAEHSDGGENPRFIVTSLPGDPQALYDDLYCQRGDAEKRVPGRPPAGAGGRRRTEGTLGAEATEPA